jgi:hypothetical protein
MRGGDDPGIIERWREVALREPERSHRAIFGAIVILFAELTDCVKQWQSGLEGWNMRESTVVAEWKAEGKAEGIAEGRAEGIAQGERRALLLVLSQRFAVPVPPDLVAAIEAQGDSNVLSQWLSLALAVDSLDAFRRAIAA